MKKYLCYKILMTGLILINGLNSYAQPGKLDPEFGNGGWVHTDLGGKEQGGTVDIQDDGKILVGGRIAIETAKYDFLLVRYLENGKLDSGFASNGVVRMDFGSNQENLEFVRALPDGKILAGGFSGANPNTNGILMKFNEDGSPDQDFGDKGMVQFRLGKSSGPIEVGLQKDGKFIVTGVCVVDSFDIDWFIARFNENGLIDSSFNSKGWIHHNFLTLEDIPFSVLVEENGNVLVTGCAGVYPRANFAFVRLLNNGTPDTSFGTNGSMQFDFAGNHDIGYTTVLTPNMRYLVSGTVRDTITNYNFALARFNYDGSPDQQFGDQGKSTYDFMGPVDYGLYMLRSEDNKYLVCGENNILTKNSFVVVQFNEDGVIDSTYGDFGIARFNAINILTDQTPHFAMQKDGKVVMTGNYKDGNNVNLLLIRWQSGLVIDSDDPAGSAFDVYLSPNPVQVNSRLYLSDDFNVNEIDLELFDVNGQSLWTRSGIVPYDNQLSLSELNTLATGMYFLKWNSSARFGTLALYKH